MIDILEPGIQATVQDYPGRRGLLAKGFFPAGPMDHLAFRAANVVVGNRPMPRASRSRSATSPCGSTASLPSAEPRRR